MSNESCLIVRFINRDVLTSHSLICTVHAIGWKNGITEQATEHTFNEFRRRASLAADGLPLDLKESTHIFKPILSVPNNAKTSFSMIELTKYPLFAIDFFTIRLIDDSVKAKNALKNAVSSLDGKVPEMIAMHLLASTDKIVQCLISSWTSMNAKDELLLSEGFTKEVSEVKKYAIEGTITDIIEKTNPSDRVFTIVDVHLP